MQKSRFSHDAAQIFLAPITAANTQTQTMRFYNGVMLPKDADKPATVKTLVSRDGVMVMCNGNALRCITIFKVMGSNV